MESKLPTLPDWTNLVFREVKSRLTEQLYGNNSEASLSMEQAFALFDTDGSGVISREEFKAALERLGFQGDADRTDLPALTEEEIEALIDSADANGDG